MQPVQEAEQEEMGMDRRTAGVMGNENVSLNWFEESVWNEGEGARLRATKVEWEFEGEPEAGEERGRIGFRCIYLPAGLKPGLGEDRDAADQDAVNKLSMYDDRVRDEHKKDKVSTAIYCV